MITYQFYGTSHGEGYGGVIKGLPEGFTFDVNYINQQLALRKCGYGRSARMQYEDTVSFRGYSGDTVTVRGDLHFFVANRYVEYRHEITALRSGHSDVVGTKRFPDKTVRQLAELSSARNSICYVVLGAICKQFLQSLGIHTYHYVKKIGGISMRNKYEFGVSEQQPWFASVHCPCNYATDLIVKAIDKARQANNSLGGVVAVGATGVPMGIGEILPYCERLDAQIAGYMMGIPSVKAISFGMGDDYSNSDGVGCHDELTVNDNDEIVYATNKCGGIVAGITTGGDVLFSLTVKPVPTIKGVNTVDSKTLLIVPQHYERADVCVVPNVGVIADNILAFVLTNQMLKQR